MVEATDLIGLDFANEKDFLECLRVVYEQNPTIYFELPGGNSLIILRQQVNELVAKLKEKGVTFSTVNLVSAGDPEVGDLTVKKRAAYISGSHFRKKQK